MTIPFPPLIILLSYLFIYGCAGSSLLLGFLQLHISPTNYFTFLFIYLWLCWVFIAAGLSPVVASGASSLLAVPGPLIAVASLAAQFGSRMSELQ